MNATHLFLSWMLRSIPAFCVGNPFHGNMITWISDPSNKWFYASWIAIGAMLIGVMVMARTSIYFAETQKALFAVTCVGFVVLLYLAAEGGKFDPTRLQHDVTVALIFIALTSAGGAWIAKAEAKS